MVFEQLWFVEEKGFERAEIARIAGFMGLTGGVMGNIFGGIAGDYYAKVTGQGRQMFLFWCILLFVPANIIYRITDDNGFIFFTCMFLGFFQWGCMYGPVFSSVQEMTPTRIRAVIVAYYLLMVNIIGLGFGITLSGIMIDYLISQGYEEPYSVTLLSFQLLSGLSLPALYYAGKNYKSDREQMLAQENINSSSQ
jgi:MFS family permease